MKTEELQQALSDVGLISRCYHFAEVESTMDRARKVIQNSSSGYHHGTLVTADYQSAGRGRQGRTWSAPVGSGVLATLVLSIDSLKVPQEENVFLLSSCALAVALCRAVRHFVPETQIKYPNDVVAHSRKLGGLLLEVHGQYLLMGFGINCLQALEDFPSDLRLPASSIFMETGKRVKIEQVLKIALMEIQAVVEPNAFPAAVGEYNSLCCTLGREILIELHEGVISGVAREIDSGGRLVLSMKSGTRKIPSSEVLRTWPAEEGPVPA